MPRAKAQPVATSKTAPKMQLQIIRNKGKLEPK
jgi:hypothetical protein